MFFQLPKDTKKKKVIHECSSSSSGSGKTPESYEELKKLGEGGQGKVWVVKRKSDKKIMVRKEQKHYRMLFDKPSEAYIFEKLLTDHPPPSIIEFYHASVIRANGTLVLYFENCTGGDLLEYMPKRGEEGRSERFLWECFIQLAEAIAFLHWGYNRRAKDPYARPRGWCRVVHRDIKPDNVFLRRNLTSKHPDPEFVLGDFGLATVTSDSYNCGTPEWIGPEIPLMTKEGDVWGVGAIVHALAHGRGPVPSPPNSWPRGREAVDRWYETPKARQPKQLSTAYSSALNRNMMGCLKKDPMERFESMELARKLRAERPRSMRY